MLDLAGKIPDWQPLKNHHHDGTTPSRDNRDDIATRPRRRRCGCRRRRLVRAFSTRVYIPPLYPVDIRTQGCRMQIRDDAHHTMRCYMVLNDERIFFSNDRFKR